MQTLIYIVYAILMMYTIIKILLDTRSTPKTLAYLLLIFVIPFLGIILYYAIGINYRHQQSITKGTKSDSEIDEQFQKEVDDKTESLIHLHKEEITHFEPLVHFLKGIANEHLSHSYFHLLINGEAKFPEVLKSLEKANHFIHMEHYDWENDSRGNQIKEVLLQKAVGGKDLRGYTQGKYRSDKIAVIQNEWRNNFYKKWGVVTFGGVPISLKQQLLKQVEC